MVNEKLQASSRLATPTISQDRSRGQSAEEDLRLASFEGETPIIDVDATCPFDPSSYMQSSRGQRAKEDSRRVLEPVRTVVDVDVQEHRPKRPNAQPPKSLHLSEERDMGSSHGMNDSSAALPELSHGKHHHVLYRVSCTHEYGQYLELYADLPTRTFQSGHYHLSGQSPVIDLQAIIKQSSLAFVVFRDLACKGPRQSVKQHAGLVSEYHAYWEESIEVIDSGLHSEIGSVARCAHDRTIYSRYFDPLGSSKDEFYHQFFYYHRDALAARIPKICSPTKEYAQDLLSFIQESHGALYDQADTLFSKGLVHRDFLKMLFCPNDVVLSKQEGVLRAFVITSQPLGSTTLKLECWYWGYDGQRLRRKFCSLALTRALKATVNIRDLEIYPLRYATDEEKNYLLQRGQKFWNLKHQTLSTYNGWDLNTDNFYVSIQQN